MLFSFAAQSIAAALVRRGHNLGDGIGLMRIYRVVGAESECEFAAVCDRFNAPDAAEARELQSGYRGQSDGAGAEHGGRLPELRRGKAERVQDDAERFPDGGLGEAQVGRQRDQADRRQVDAIAEESGLFGRAHERTVLAEIVAARHAGFAVVAVNRGFQRYAVPG
jgi:hypothetical protein